jgi:hypothetical protein
MGDGEGDGGRDEREDRGEGAHTDDWSNSGRFSSKARRSMSVETYGMAPDIPVGLEWSCIHWQSKRLFIKAGKGGEWAI